MGSPVGSGDEDVDADWPDRTEITDPQAVALLTDVRALPLLAPFLASMHTLTSAARVAKRPVSSMAYWVPRFERARLIVRHGEFRRAGAPMPRYRAPARELVVPLRYLPFDARVRMLDAGRMRILRRFFDGIDEALAASDAYGLRFAAVANGGSQVDLEATDAVRGSAAFTDGWRSLDLTEADATELSRELESLVERYAGRGGPKRFWCHGGLAPEPAFRWRSADDR